MGALKSEVASCQISLGALVGTPVDRSACSEPRVVPAQLGERD